VSDGCEPVGETLCGCCSGLTGATPEAITNRPALSSIAYRAGRWATFDASMLSDLSGSSFPQLAQLRTRDPSDFSIALLDAWAVALDILTFYQERFANEAYLRTAVDQRSLFELAALVGYQPSPGVAASAVLAFTLSSAPGSPDNVLIAAGTPVQSVPVPGQTAQVFETSSDLTAKIGWKALAAQTTSSWQLQQGDTATWIQGTTNNISVGDALLFVTTQPGAAIGFHYVTGVSTNANAQVTQITWDTPLEAAFGTAPLDSTEISIYTFAKKAGLYGANAPDPRTLNGSTLGSIPGYQAGEQWTYTVAYADYSDQIYLDSTYPGLAPAPGGPPQWVVLTGTTDGYTSVFQITETPLDATPGMFTLTAKATLLSLEKIQTLVGDKSLTTNELLYLFVQETPSITAYVGSQQLIGAGLPLTTWNSSTGAPPPAGQQATWPTQAGMVDPVCYSTLSVIGGQTIAAGAPIAVSGKPVRLQIGLDVPGTLTFVPDGQISGTPPAPGQVFYVNAFPPIADQVNGQNILWTVATLSGQTGTLSAPQTGAVTLQPATQKDVASGESAVVQSVAVAGDVTTLTLAKPLQGIYDATTLTVNANAAWATNGQTVQEILGSGSAADDALQFTLKQSPLTYVPASSGVQSTLQVWVNNLQWQQVPNLLSSGPADRAFTTDMNAAGNTVIAFGNGVQGARTPTGTSNVRAVYRTGIGTPGMVAAGAISQPLTRPSGLMSVSNPSAATGAADPATADEARASAPLPTLTIGRVVSLDDYQSFALAFPGIAKAWATWTWFGDVRGVFLTVAGADGTVLADDDPILTSLIGAITLCNEPFVPLQVASFQPVQFTFSALVAVDQPTYDPGQVLSAVWQALSAAFAFDQRQLGQGVAASEVIELIQQVAGVTALQLQSLGRSGAVEAPPRPLVCASAPAPPLGAEMLVLDPTTRANIGRWQT
jgi:hypothetical protein